jgi:hypothetical protein
MAKIGTKCTITLQDGTTRQITETGYATAGDSGVQVDIISAQQRARRLREHLRVIFYTMESGNWKRCSKDPKRSSRRAAPDTALTFSGHSHSLRVALRPRLPVNYPLRRPTGRRRSFRVHTIPLRGENECVLRGGCGGSSSPDPGQLHPATGAGQ